MDGTIDSGYPSGGARTETAAAYGSQGATGHFDPTTFIKKPSVILRLTSWVFAVIVFGCISSSAWNATHCYFNGDSGACGYGTFVGITAFLLCMAFLVLDALFDNLSNAVHRKYIVMADFASSGVMSFLWFVCFCYLANAWRITTDKSFWHGASAMEAAIAFSFFSIGTFVALTVLAVLRYRQGVETNTAPQYNSEPYRGFDDQPLP